MLAAELVLLAVISMGVISRTWGAELNITIIHNNDMHARFEETSALCGRCHPPNESCYGGWARMAHLVREYRMRPNVLYLNAGDTYTGTAWFTLFKHNIAIEFINMLKPDVASLGNHEFDEGVAGLIPFLEKVNFPVIAANVFDPRLKNLKKSVILTVGGHQICVIGYLTPQTKEISSGEDVTFTDEVEAINEEAEVCAAKGVKTFIGLGHSGFEMDKIIAKNCPRIDVVVGGHTNTFLWNGPKPSLEKPEGPYPVVVTQPSGKKVPVVQAFAYTKYLGILNLKIDTTSGKILSFHGNPILVNSSIPQEPDVLKALEKYRPEVEALDNKIMGRSKVLLEGRDYICRRKECNLGNFFADAYIDYKAMHYSGSYWTDTAIAMMNSGGIRSSIDTSKRKGDISYADMYAALPFNNDLVTVILSGTELLEVLEFSVHSNGETSEGEFLQYSGIKVTYDRSKPIGQRLISAMARCASCSTPIFEPIVGSKDYKVIVPTFIANGGDGYKVLKNARNKTVLSINDFDSVLSYIGKLKTIYPGLEDRITLISSSASSMIISKYNLLILLFIYMFAYLR